MSPEGQETPRKRRRSPARLIIIVGGILVLEAAVIIGAMTLLGGPPEVEAAEVPAVLEAPEDERIVEILVLDGKLPNNKSGMTYLYDTEIYVQVKQRYAEEVAEELSQFRNEIKSEITAVWRTAEPRHFQEPRLQTLTRRVQTMLGDRFGVDRQHDEPIISKCVIVMGMGFRIDG
jgi:hypothetical protein